MLKKCKYDLSRRKLIGMVVKLGGMMRNGTTKLNRSCQIGKLSHMKESGFYPKPGEKPLAGKLQYQF